LIAIENLEYTCRTGVIKDGKESIQESIGYVFEAGECKELRECIVTITLPDGTQRSYNSNTDAIIRDDKQGINPISLSNDAALICCDKLKVQINTVTVINEKAFHVWKMTNPTRNVQIHIVAPDTYKVSCEVFAKKEKCSIVHSLLNCCTITLKTWMLPQNGFVFQISKNDST